MTRTLLEWFFHCFVIHLLHFCVSDPHAYAAVVALFKCREIKMNEGPNSKKEIISCFNIIFSKIILIEWNINNIIVNWQIFDFNSYFLLTQFSPSPKKNARKVAIERMMCSGFNVKPWEVLSSVIYCIRYQEIFFQQDTRYM